MYKRQRDVKAILKAIPPTIRTLLAQRPDVVVSTGAGVALAVFPVAWLLGIERYYIESVARVDGPSVTGRILQWLPGTHLYTQHGRWASARWVQCDSVIDSYAIEETDEVHVSRVFVTLGTIRPYPVSYTHLTLPTNREV